MLTIIGIASLIFLLAGILMILLGKDEGDKFIMVFGAALFVGAALVLTIH